MAKTPKKTPDLSDPSLYINRELSWLEFNGRVLAEGLSPELPPLERLKFLAIVSSNLDEFFLIRVAGLMQLRAAGSAKRDASGLTVREQLDAISARAHQMVAQQTSGIAEVLGLLREHGMVVLSPADWTAAQSEFLQTHFREDVGPVLTPLAVQQLDPMPLLPGMCLHVALVLAGQTPDDEPTLVVLPVPGQLARFVTVPGAEGTHLALLEDVIAAHAGQLFPDGNILAAASFRITRDADVAIDDDAGDLLEAVQEAIQARRRRHAVRLVISADPHPHLRRWLLENLDLTEADVYEISGMLDAAALMELANRQGYEDLKNIDWPPQPPRDLIGSEDIFQTIRTQDVLLNHPYESFDPVVQLVAEAAEDPNVLAIKQTLYRTSGDSPIVQALQTAAESGKQVTVLVELKARFDESRNVDWARRLEDAGCHVIYGVAGFKTHAKALLIVRREAGVIRRYVHLSTGNYNDKTARLYCDIGLMTAEADLTQDVANFFNLVTGSTEGAEYAKLTIAPTGLRRKFRELIEREIEVSTPEQPGLIVAKVNSLEDADICEALYRASQAGVQIRLNVRGICCLRPGVKGASRNIEVRSIVDRFLEHARVFHFRNGGHEEVYFSSADWMGRNLDKRLELMFPILDPRLRRRVVGWLDMYFADNLKAKRLLKDGSYEPVQAPGKAVRAQLELYQEASDAARAAERMTMRFRPLSGPQD